MKKTKDFNNVPEKYIPKLARNAVAVFQLVGIKPDRFNPGKMLLPEGKNIPSTDTVMIGEDDYSIAALRGVTDAGRPIFYDIMFERKNGGMIRLTGNSVRDVAIYQYMMLCNYREKKGRDVSKRIIFKLVDAVTDAKTDMEIRSQSFDAMAIAKGMTPDQIKEILAARGQGVDGVDVALLRNHVEQWAENDPEGFIKASAGRTIAMKALIQGAIEKKLIKFNPNTKEFRYTDTGELILTAPKKTKASAIEAFVNYVETSDDGKAVYEELKRLLDGLQE